MDVRDLPAMPIEVFRQQRSVCRRLRNRRQMGAHAFAEKQPRQFQASLKLKRLVVQGVNQVTSW
jgi:hypothetical protein